MAENNTKKATEFIYHTVKKGETLYNVSKKYNVAAAELKTLNNLNNNALTIGQLLKIKEK